MSEEWKPIRDFEGYYQVSNYGRIRSLARRCKHRYGTRRVRQKIKVQTKKRKNNRSVMLSLPDLKPNSFLVQTLVAQAFLGQQPKGSIIAHRDKNKGNNRAKNLFYCDPKVNLKRYRVTKPLGARTRSDP